MTNVEWEKRLTNLEKANARLRGAMVIGLVAALGAIAAGQAGPSERVSRADGFEVVDKAGNVRVSIGVMPQVPDLWGMSLRDGKGRPCAAMVAGPDGSPALMLVDKDSTPRIHVAIGDDGPFVALHDERNKQRACLSLGSDGVPCLRLTEKVGKGGTYLTSSPDGGSGLTFDDKDGTHRLSLYTRPDGGPALRFADGGGKDRLRVGASPEGPMGLSLIDRGGKPVAVLRSTSEDSAAFLVIEGGRVRAALGSTIVESQPTAPSSLVLLDSEGKVVFRAPTQ